jgi:Cu+-exporting ATPase
MLWPDAFEWAEAPVAWAANLPASWLAQAVLSSGVQFAAGAAFYRAAWHGLKRGQPNMQLLVSLGTTAAWGYSLLAMALAAQAIAASNAVGAGLAVGRGGGGGSHSGGGDSGGGGSHGGGGHGGMAGGYHVYFETSALIITFVCLGKWLEARAKAHTSDVVTSLLALRAKTAILLQLAPASSAAASAAAGTPQSAGKSKGKGGGKGGAGAGDDGGLEVVAEEEIAAELVQAGDVLRVPPGATVPADGTVLAGRGAVDESMVTGESLPVPKRRGDAVIGGACFLGQGDV